MKKVTFDLLKNKNKIVSNHYDPYSELENSIIENINNILNYDDLLEKNSSNNEYESNEILEDYDDLLEKNSSDDEYESNEIFENYDDFLKKNSSDDEYESNEILEDYNNLLEKNSSIDECNEILEDFEGTFYDNKFKETKIRLKEYNILVENNLNNYNLIINNKKYNFNIIEELYEFETIFFKYLEEKNIYKKKNKKNKKKFNESLNVFLNKYEIFREDFENILKFNIQENSTNKIITDEDNLMNQMIKSNIDYLKDNLDKNINNFNTLINEDIIILEKIFFEIENFYNNYLEYNKLDIENYQNRYDEIKQIYSQKKFLNLVDKFKNFKIIFTQKHLHNLINKNDFKKKYNIDDKSFNEVDKRFKKDIHLYNISFKNLSDFYNNNKILQSENNIFIFNKCKKRFSYFNNANIDKKNDFLNNIIFNLEAYFHDKSSLNLIDMKQDYIDYIFYLPDNFFYEKNVKLSNKEIKEDFSKFFNKYDITYDEHLKFLSIIPYFFKKQFLKKK